MDTRTESSRLQQADLAVLIVRLALGAIFFAHGAQKLLGWWGGNGWAGTIQGMGGMGIPAPLAALAILTEFFGGLAVIVGALTRLAALGLAVVMLVAIAKVHFKNGFFMSDQGFEYNLALLALALAVVAYGAGRWSLDAMFSATRRRTADTSANVVGRSAAV